MGSEITHFFCHSSFEINHTLMRGVLTKGSTLNKILHVITDFIMTMKEFDILHGQFSF